MFYSRVCLGEAHSTAISMRDVWKPPERSDKRGLYNSVRAKTLADGRCVEYLEDIVYKGTQAYPEYMITYEQKPDCKCTHCYML